MRWKRECEPMQMEWTSMVLRDYSKIQKTSSLMEKLTVSDFDKKNTIFSVETTFRSRHQGGLAPPCDF